jgi:hypothetical protein
MSDIRAPASWNNNKKNLRLGRLWLFSQIVFLFFLFFTFSFVLLHFYINGDQKYYIIFYDQISNLDFLEAYLLAKPVIGASEPVSLFILWLGSSLEIDKNIYVSTWNAALLLLLWRFCKRHHVKPFVFFLIVLNFYTLVLLTGAERLKFGYTFIIFASFLSNRTKPIGVLIACLAHFQMFLVLPSIVIASRYNEILRLTRYGLIRKSSFYLFLISITFFPLLFSGFNGAISYKFTAYFDSSRNIESLTNVMLLTVAALLATSNWKRMFFSIAPFYVLIMMFGGDRVNMLAVTVVLWILISERRIGHPISLVLLIYFFLKAFGFMYRTLLFGDAFAN